MAKKQATGTRTLSFIEWRVECGYKQADLAEKLGVSQGYISNLTTGKSEATKLFIIAFDAVFGEQLARENIRIEWSTNAEYQRKRIRVSTKR